MLPLFFKFIKSIRRPKIVGITFKHKNNALLYKRIFRETASKANVICFCRVLFSGVAEKRGPLINLADLLI